VKIRAVEADLFLADGEMDKRTDMMQLIIAFRNFGKAPKNGHPLVLEYEFHFSSASYGLPSNVSHTNFTLSHFITLAQNPKSTKVIISPTLGSEFSSQTHRQRSFFIPYASSFRRASLRSLLTTRMNTLSSPS
jgi:hypothetical protein